MKRFYTSFLPVIILSVLSCNLFAQVVINNITYSNNPSPYTVSASGTVPPCGAATGTLTVSFLTNSLPAGTKFDYDHFYFTSHDVGSRTTVSNGELITLTFNNLAGSQSGVFHSITLRTPKIPPAFNDSSYIAVINLQVFSTKNFSAVLNKIDPTCPSPPNTGSATVNVLSGTPPYTYNWTAATPNPGNAATASNLLAQTVTVYVKDASGCDTTMTQTLTVIKPTVSLTANPNPVCTSTLPVSITFTATGASPNPGAGQYYWDGATIPISANTKTDIINAYGNDSHSVVYQDGAGCLSDPASLSVPIDSKPTGTVTPPTASVCPGATTVLMGNVTNCGGRGVCATNQYSFNGGATYQASGSYTTPAINSDTTITIRFINAAGCVSDPITVNIDTLGKPKVTASASPNPICPNNTSTITASFICNPSCAGYQMSINGGALSATSPQMFVTPSLTTTTTYPIHATNATGCVFDTSVTVVVYTNTLAITNPATALCFNNTGSTVTLTATGFRTAPLSPLSWASNPSGLSGDGAVTTSIVASSPSVYQPTISYTVTGIDVNGCPRQASTTINVNPQPTVTIPATVNYCEGTSLVLTASGIPSSSGYTWYSAGYAASLFTGNPYNAPSPTANITYNVIGTDVNGCKDSAQTNVIFRAKPTGTASASPSTLCAGNYSDITVIIDNPPFTPAAASISNNNGGSYVTPITNNLGPFTTTTTVNNRVKDQYGCISDPIPVTVTVNPFTALETQHTDVSCNGLSDGSSTITVTGGTAPYSYSSNVIGGPYTAAANPRVITNLPAGVTRYYVIDNSPTQKCSTFVDVTITQPLPLSITENTSVHKNVLCFGQSNGSFAVTTGGGTVPYTFTLNGAAQGSSTTYSNLAGALAPGGLSYKVVLTDSKGCKDSVSVTIFSPTDLLVPTATGTKNVCFGQNNASISIGQASQGTGPNYTYSLQGTSQTITTSGVPTSPTFTNLLPPGPFNVVVSDGNGCSKTQAVTIPYATKIAFGPTSVTADTCGSGQGGIGFINPATGGTSPYTYTFNGATQTLPYTLTSVVSGVSQSVRVVDALSCPFDTAFTVSNSQRAVPYVTVTANKCFGDNQGIISIDSLQSNIPGYSPSPPYNYGLSVDVNPLQASLPWANTIAGGSSPLFNATFSNLLTHNYVVEIQDMYKGAPCYYPMNKYWLKNTTASGYTFYDNVVNPAPLNVLYSNVSLGGPADISAGVFSHESDLNLSNGSVWVYDITGGTPAVSNGKPVYQLAVDNPNTYQSYVPRDTSFSQGTVSLYTVLGGYAPGAHTLYIKDANNCTKVISIDVPGNFFIPNLVIPGSTKEKNRTFYITSLPDNSQLRVYNRWGDRVYYNKAYDNTFDAAGLGDGVYYYDLELITGTRYKGWVQVTTSGN